MDLQNAQMIVAEHMDGILECFKQPAKITVCVRRPGLPEQDFVMTNDAMVDVIEMLKRRETAGASP